MNRAPDRSLVQCALLRPPAILAGALALLLITGVAFGASGQDILAQARGLATSKHRPEALALLESHLQSSPSDVDARLLYGLILSWDSRYDESRTQLSRVLSETPGYSDALLALINVELWSGHPDRAEELAGLGLEKEPGNTELMLRRARALRALNRSDEAVHVLSRALDLDPDNTEARSMRATAHDESRPWTLTAYHSFDGFPNGDEPWQEYSLQLGRATPAGTVLTRFSRADRFGVHSNLSEIDFYPHIRRGMYAYLNFGYSGDGTLYPRFRGGVDLYQMIGRGFEASGGLRRLAFSSPVNIYTGSLGKYHRNWLFTVRGFFTPDSAGTSVSGQLSARRYIGEQGDYVGVRFGRGSSPTEIQNITDLAILNSTSGSAEFSKTLGRWYVFGVRAGWSREDRLGRSTLDRVIAISNLGLRF